MKSHASIPSKSARPFAHRRFAPQGKLLSLSIGLVSGLSCSSAPPPQVEALPAPTVAAPNPTPSMMMAAPSPDPRVGLKGGWFDAGSAIWNMKLISSTPPSEKFMNASTPGEARLKSSDLAFTGRYVIQGNYSGYQIWDIANVAKPTLATVYVCPGQQSDVSVYRNLMFVSHEATASRIDCDMKPIPDPSSPDRARGIRIYEISDVAHPKMLTVVQTCRGSHTHTVVHDPKDNDNVYLYVSGTSGVRPATELAGCIGGLPDSVPNSAQFRIEVIKVPLAHPEQAAIVNSPRVVKDLVAPPQHSNPDAGRDGGRAGGAAGGGVGAAGADSAGAAPGRAGGGAGGGRAPILLPNGQRAGPLGCHDITVYPDIGLAGGACGGYGLLIDIRDVAHPVRIDAVADSNFSFWHSATFSNDGSKILFSDEWGGGTQPRCRATDKLEWGSDAIFSIVKNKMQFQGYYKMPAAQDTTENCVAHNGSLIPIPGREVMVQAWYQGGISVFDWTDSRHAKEIAFFDQGPLTPTKLTAAGHWSSYWYNGNIISSDEARGLVIFELTPSAMISQNEIDAAKLVHMDFLNVQDQPKLVWPAHFAVARAYLDQLTRSNGLPAGRIVTVRNDLARAEGLAGAQRRDALNELMTHLDADAMSSTDAPKVRLLSGVVRDLAKAVK